MLRNPGASDLFGEGGGRFRDIFRVVAVEGLEGGIQTAPIFKTNGSDAGTGIAVPGVVLLDAHELIAVREGQWAEEDSVDGGKDGGISANAESKSENDR